MINVNELRVGNLLLTNTGTVVPIRGGGIAAIESGRLIMSPIPLTPEWLERCGFEKQDDGSCNVQIGNTIYLEFSKALVCSITPGVWFDYACKTRSEIKHLHQLQNLYFVMTGEELTINHEAIAIN